MTTIPRPEHPRPDFQRPDWLNLNGPWRFAFDPRAIGEQERWHRPYGRPKPLTIIVPFPWESRLSGLGATDYKGAAWYEREITIPPEWEGKRVFLHFGAVDWSARVWLNGRLVAEHANGYLPFSAELTGRLRPGQTGTLTVRAYDIADPANPVGKQVPRWYTHTSGIWQTVWLEARAPSHVQHCRLTPDLPGERVQVQLTLDIARPGPYRLRLRSPDDAFPVVEDQRTLAPGQHTWDLVLPVPAPHPWSPDDPFLYRLIIDLEPLAGGPADQVETYFGLRSISRACWEGRDYEYILLNGEPVYLRGALDQAFHPDGIYTYPSDEVIRGDIALARELGLNLLRCHIKINDPRYYYWADRLGVLIMYDLPSPDIDTPQMRRTWEATLRGAIARDFNHPSIFAWVLFNETWGLENHDTPEGQAWVRTMYHLAKQLDPTRLVEDNSPIRYDHVATDINSWHFYLTDYDQVRRHVERVVRETYPGSTFNFTGGARQDRQPLMNSEYAGISARMGDQDISWSFKYQTTELRRHAKICGYVYTELTDVEWEHNGFVNYDRSRKEFGYDFFVAGMSVRDLNSPDFIGFDAPPCQTLPPGSPVHLPVFVSHFGPPLGPACVTWRLEFTDRFAERRTLAEGSWTLHPRRFDVTPVETLHLRLPEEPGLATVALWLRDAAGQVRCRNYVNIEVWSAPAPRLERQPAGWVLRFAPGDFAATSWPSPLIAPGGGKFAATGAGWVEYHLALPPDLPPADLRALRLRCEASARAGLAKVDWRERAQATDYPQTEERTFPSDLVVTVNGVCLAQLRLPDDPADARGVLSHHHGRDPGSYGYLLDLHLTGEALAPVRRALLAGDPLVLRFTIPADAPHPGGLALYGERLGCYPLDPTVVLETL